MAPLRFAVTAIVVAALGVVSLQRPTALWAGIAWSLASTCLLAAIVRAVVLEGEARTWWLGFALVGGTYSILTYNQPPLEYVEGCMPTTRALDELYLAVHAEPIVAAARIPVDAWDMQKHEPGRQDASTFFNINQVQFRWAWHSLLVIPLGLVGGAMAVRIARPRIPASSRRVLSIPMLMAVVLAFGAAFAALHTPSGLTLNVTFGTLAVSLAWAALEAASSQGRRRAFWLGYALFGWAYLFAAFGQFEVRLLVFASALAEGYLPTSRLFGELFPLLHPAPGPSTGIHEAWNPSYHRPARLAPIYLYDLNRHFFVQIGHALSGILVGVIGGMIAASPGRQAAARG